MVLRQVFLSLIEKKVCYNRISIFNFRLMLELQGALIVGGILRYVQMQTHGISKWSSYCKAGVIPWLKKLSEKLQVTYYNAC